MEKRKACFIIPYFGTLPNIFPVYLRTCEANPDFDWLIITDDHTAYDYPPNVHCVYTTFGEFVNRVQSHFDFPISLERPYKICDFRAAFGVIFQKELENYRFWGHCDLDQYFGRISNFVTDEILDNYDKILCLGHFTLFRNCPKINEMYRIPDKAWNQSYRDAFSQPKHWIFDEWPSANTCINRIMKQEGVNTYYRHDAFCDLVPFVSRFRRYIFDHEVENWTEEDIRNTVFVWDKGQLFCCHKDVNGEVVYREMLYVHIRQRKMDVSKYDAHKSTLHIYPNRIESVDLSESAAVKKCLRAANFRGFFYPDELRRKLVMLNGYLQAALRRIKKFFRLK